MSSRDDHGFVDISANGIERGIDRSIVALPDASLVMMMALPFGSTRPLATRPSHQSLTAVTQTVVGELSI
jgi:hypothetical protein